MKSNKPSTLAIVGNGLAALIAPAAVALFIIEATVLIWLNEEFIRMIFFIGWAGGAGALLGHAWRADNTSPGWWTALILGTIVPLAPPFVYPVYWYSRIWKPSRSSSPYDAIEDAL